MYCFINGNQKKNIFTFYHQYISGAVLSHFGLIKGVESVFFFFCTRTFPECREESRAFQRELAGLSERYSQKCLELNRAEQSNGEREREISRKERDMEQLRKENQVSPSGGRKRVRRMFSPLMLKMCSFPFNMIWQDLKARLKEEMGRSQAAVGDRRSEDAKDGTSCELQVVEPTLDGRGKLLMQHVYRTLTQCFCTLFTLEQNPMAHP